MPALPRRPSQPPRTTSTRLRSLAVAALLTPLAWLAYALSVTATGCAWTLTRRDRGHAPAALLLSTGLASDLLRRVLSVAVLAPAHAALGAAPFPPSLLWAVAVEVALQLAYPAAVASAALAVYVPRRRVWWPVVAAWALLSAALVAVYPAVRGDALAAVYRVAHGVAAGVGAVALVRLTQRRGVLTCAGRVVLFTTAADGVGVIVPWGQPFTRWDLARVAYSSLCAVLITVQLRALWTAPPTSSSSASATSPR